MPTPRKDAPVAAIHAEFARIQAQGQEKTAREITALEYPNYRALMKAGGLDVALGGEAPADAALRGLFASYETRVRSFESDLPKLLQMSGTGIDIGYSGFAASMIIGMLQNDAALTFWERAQGEGQPSGSHTQSSNDSSIDLQWSGSQSTMTSSFEGDMPGGLTGKLTTKVDVTTCPDADGKVTARFTSDSSLRSKSQAGTGGFIKVDATISQYLDDDAHVMSDRMDSDVRVEQKTFDSYEGSFVNVTDVLSTTTGEMGSKVTGRSKRASDADVQGAQGLAKMGRMAAMQALDRAGKAWESGRCIKLDVTSDPGKRKGVKPSTSFAIVAAPRVKSDGSFPGGSVRATLSGGESLTRDGEKVRADAQYTYTAPAKKDETASIAFESRSKRGVGKATLEFDTKEKKSYRISGIGDCPGPWDVCDISKPFTFAVCGGSMTHTPKDERGGSQVFTHSGAKGTGSYTLSGPEEKMTAIYQNTTCAMGRCFKTPPGKATWTKIDTCE